MRVRIFYFILLICLCGEVSVAQTVHLQEVMKNSVELYSHYKDSLDNDIELRWGRPPLDRSFHCRYVLPELIGLKDIQFTPNSKQDNYSFVWIKSPLKAKRLLSKERSKNYQGYYQTSLNIENGEVVVYVMTGLQGKTGEALQGRFSYGIKDGNFELHTIEYQWTDTKTTYHNPNTEKVVSKKTYEDMFAIFFDDSITTKTFSDTIDVLRSVTQWKDVYFPEVNGVHYTYRSFLGKKTFSDRSKPFLAVNYSFNQHGDILVYFRTIFCQEQKGRYKNMQQHCSSAFVFTLSQDADGVFQISSYRRIMKLKCHILLKTRKEGLWDKV